MLPKPDVEVHESIFLSLFFSLQAHLNGTLGHRFCASCRPMFKNIETKTQI